ncbi:unnamed protein product [Acanthoscelides obtectus]|uniref:Uncharacterized protein n=1 Tax=Acanthoscelides obtectus TaxID=200917 RepID=A0A9P0MIZ6_ACAOB|nr:unnamed protein product [Acanthoscelides obtectus]CAK1623588.1 hypothetical protein AOBTE_LOCUS2086 [Acanthoscelides obtectus]
MQQRLVPGKGDAVLMETVILPELCKF